MSRASSIWEKIASATSCVIWRATTKQFTAHHQLWNLLLIFLSSSLWPWSKAELPQKDTCSDWRLVFTSISGGSICGGWSDKDLCAMMSLLTCFFCMEQTKTEQFCEKYSSVSTDLLFLKTKLLSSIWLFFVVLQLIFCFSRTNFLQVFLSVPMLPVSRKLFFFLLLLKSQHTSQAEAIWKLNTNSPATKAQSNFPIVSHPKKKEKKKAKNAPATKTKNATHTQQLNIQKMFHFWLTKDRDQGQKIELRLLLRKAFLLISSVGLPKHDKGRRTLRPAKALNNTHNAKKLKKKEEETKDPRPSPQPT